MITTFGLNITFNLKIRETVIFINFKALKYDYGQYKIGCDRFRRNIFKK